MNKLFSHLPENTPPQAHKAIRTGFIMLASLIPVVLLYFYLAFRTNTWQVFVAAGAVTVYMAINLAAIWQARHGNYVWAAHSLIYGLLGGLFIFNLVIANFGIILGAAATMLAISVSGQLLPPRLAQRAILATLLGSVVMIVIDLIAPAYRAQMPQLQVYIPVVLGILAIIFGVTVVRQFRNYSLRTKLLASILFTTGLSVMIFVLFAAFSFGRSQSFMIDQLQVAVRSQSKQQLGDTTLAEIKTADEKLSDVANEVKKLAEYQAALYAQSSILGQGTYWNGNNQLSKLSGGQYGNPQSDIASVFIPSTVAFDKAMAARLNTNIYMDFTAPAVLKSNPDIAAVYFAGVDGSTIYYPNVNLAEVLSPDFDPRERPFFTIATPENNPEHKVVWTEPYQDAAGNGLLVTSAAPVFDQAGKFMGVVAADMRLIDITENVSAIKIGQSGFAFLVDSSGHVIGMHEAGYKIFNLSPETVAVEETPIQTVLGLGPVELQAVTRKMTVGETGLETINIQGEQFYVSYAPLASVGYSLGIVAPVAELDAPYLTARDQVESGAQTATRLASIILIGVLLAAAGASLLLSRFLSGPIVRLTTVAEQVTAGDMEVQAKVESADEIGTLADAFNRMTAQLRDSFATLEARVAQRTQNLELAAEVGHAVSQVHALDLVLKDAVEIIRTRFNLYYVQVYLVNPSQTYLDLQAGTGHVGPELVRRSHRLPLNTDSINGRAALEKKSVVISDTLASSTFKPNPLLPDTRAEMAVPLMIGDRVVGVLDMQSERAGSLSRDILPAFKALAGQLAIAIQNATLLARANQARAQLEAQAQHLSRSNWADYLDAIHKPEEIGFVFEQNKVAPLKKDAQIKDGALVVPISVTGETLGNLVVEMEGRSPIPQAEELINTVVNQVAQQIENLRLLESAERFRFEAEEASRRLTHEGWKDYMDIKAKGNLSYIYDLNEVRAHTHDESQHIVGPALRHPIKVRDETVGKLVIQGIETDDRESLELVNAVAERLGAHIEGLRLSKQTEQALAATKKQAQREHVLRQITSAVRGSTDPATILRTAARELGTLLGRKTIVRLKTTTDLMGDSTAASEGQLVSPAESYKADGGNK